MNFEINKLLPIINISMFVYQLDMIDNNNKKHISDHKIYDNDQNIYILKSFLHLLGNIF